MVILNAITYSKYIKTISPIIRQNRVGTAFFSSLVKKASISASTESLPLRNYTAVRSYAVMKRFERIVIEGELPKDIELRDNTTYICRSKPGYSEVFHVNTDYCRKMEELRKRSPVWREKKDRWLEKKRTWLEAKNEELRDALYEELKRERQQLIDERLEWIIETSKCSEEMSEMMFGKDMCKISRVDDNVHQRWLKWFENDWLKEDTFDLNFENISDSNIETPTCS